MIRRYLQETILQSLNHFPAVLLTGARQVGKSTLAQGLIETSWKANYFTLDDRITLDGALKDPDGFIESLPTPAVIDEVQRAPDLLRSIKRKIDRERRPGQYLLTGSANILRLSTVFETLAGRIALHTLHPFCWPELLEKPIPDILDYLFRGVDSKKLLKTYSKTYPKEYKSKLIERILRGGYPTPALMDSDHVRWQWFSSYRQTYLERDLLNIRSIEHLPDFNRLLSLVALRTARLLNLSDFSRETGLPFTTLRRYMNLLEVTYQIYFIRPYFSHPGKRLIKTPKLYFNDTGMACHLIGANDWKVLENQANVGPMVETWVASELLKLLSLKGDQFKLYFWRTQTGHEVDFLIEWAGRFIAIEVKWGHSIDESEIKNLKRLAEELKDKLLFTVVLYSGKELIPFNPKTVVMPFPTFFGI